MNTQNTHGRDKGKRPFFLLLQRNLIRCHIKKLSDARVRNPKDVTEKGFPLKCWGSMRRGTRGLDWIGFYLAICSHFDRERYLRQKNNNKRFLLFFSKVLHRINPLEKANPKTCAMAQHDVTIFGYMIKIHKGPSQCLKVGYPVRSIYLSLAPPAIVASYRRKETEPPFATPKTRIINSPASSSLQPLFPP